jgi:predicted NAD/FAD-binding protein
VLAAVRYQPNRAVLHTDASLLPRDRKLWSAWNYFAGSGDPGEQPVGVSYLINRLQPLPFETPVVVTLNPAREPDPAKVIAEFDYDHPIFDGPAIAAQQRLADDRLGIQGEGGIWLAGAWGVTASTRTACVGAARRQRPWASRRPGRVSASVSRRCTERLSIMTPAPASFSAM